MAAVNQGRVKPLKDAQKYTIGIVCALPKEADAVQASFDHVFTDQNEKPNNEDGDMNYYDYGTLAGRYVVLARMGENKQGPKEAGDVAGQMYRTFKNIKLCLVVGITAIIPIVKTFGDKECDVMMGDVIISKVVKPYTYGREYPTGFVPKETYPQATTGQLRFFSWIQSRANMRHLRERLKTHLLELEQNEDMLDFQYPGYALDHLYEADYVHEHRPEPHQQACDKCSKNEYCEKAIKLSCADLKCSHEHLVSISTRPRLEKLENFPAARGDGKKTILLKNLEADALKEVLPMIFLGDIASGDKVMKDGAQRDKLAAEHDVIGFEMEGAGVWDTSKFPTFVIKAGCDYGDSHKNKKWQEYASMTAAACAKAFLENLQMGIPQNVEYGEGFACVSGDSESTNGTTAQNPATKGGTTIYNRISGNVDGSNFNMGNTYNADGDINIGANHSRRRK